MICPGPNIYNIYFWMLASGPDYVPGIEVIVGIADIEDKYRPIASRDFMRSILRAPMDKDVADVYECLLHDISYIPVATRVARILGAPGSMRRGRYGLINSFAVGDK